jgi:hypothetical protein
VKFAGDGHDSLFDIDDGFHHIAEAIDGELSEFSARDAVSDEPERWWGHALIYSNAWWRGFRAAASEKLPEVPAVLFSSPFTDPQMIASLLRLFALRPFLTMAILGIPIIVLIAVGLLTIVVMKFLVLVVLPVVVVVWLVRRLFGSKERQPLS